MTIICLLICDKNGKLFFARQFISLFSKNDFFTNVSIFINSYNPNSDLNYMEINNYRYLYKVLNSKFFLILISSKNNINIIMEQEALKTCHTLIQQRLGLEITEQNIRKEGINLAIDLEEIIENGLIQDLHIGKINTKINMIRVDKNEIKKKIEQKNIKQRELMIKQFKEMEKLEELNENNKNDNDKKDNEDIQINFTTERLNKNKNNAKENKSYNGNDSIPGNIRLNIKFELVQVKKPIVFKTPSGKVVLLGEQKKPVETRKEKLIKGLKLGK